MDFEAFLFFVTSTVKPVQIRRRPHAVANARQNAPLIELVREVRVAARDLSHALPALPPVATCLDILDQIGGDVRRQSLDELGCGSKRLENRPLQLLELHGRFRAVVDPFTQRGAFAPAFRGRGRSQHACRMRRDARDDRQLLYTER